MIHQTAAQFLLNAKHAIGEGEYVWGGPGVSKLDTSRVYTNMDCSSFASWVIGALFGKEQANRYTTMDFMNNPYKLPELPRDGIRESLQNLPLGSIVQFNYVGEGKRRHTGFFFKDPETGELKVMDFRGGNADQLVLEDAEGMLRTCLRKPNCKFFLIEKGANGVNLGAAERHLGDLARGFPDFMAGVGGVSDFVKALFGGFGLYEMLIAAAREQEEKRKNDERERLQREEAENRRRKAK